MQILSLDLENTKSYANAHIEFTPGVNAIVGHNGAGKSTILEAIGLAVFDSIDYRQNDFVNSAAKSASVTVSILSSLDQRRYQVVRRIGSSNQHYIYDPELESRICEGKADVLAFLRQHLGVEAGTDLTALFRDAVGVSQGTFTAAFLETPARRKPIFDSLLQVEEYQRAYDRLREPLNLLKERQQAMEVELATLTARLERLPELREARSRKQREQKEVGLRLEQVAKELAEAEKERTALETIRTEVAELTNKAAQLAERVGSVSKNLAAARQSLHDAEDARAVVTTHQAGYAHYLDAQARQKDLDAQLRERQRLEGERAKRDKSVALGEANLTKLQESLGESRAAQETAKQLEGAVEQQQAIEAALAQAKQQQARLKDAQESAQRLRQQLQRLEERLPQLESAQTRAVKLDEERAATDNQIAELRHALDEHKNETAQFVVQADAIKEQTEALKSVETALCPVCEQPLTPDHRSEMIARNEERVMAMRHSYADVQKQVKAREGQLQEKERRAETILSEIRGLPRAEEVTDLRKEIEEQHTLLTQANARVDELKAAPAQIEQLSQELQALGNPMQQYAIAQERASRLPTIEKELESVNQKLLQERKVLAELHETLTQFADLDERMDATGADLQRHQEAYQLVLSNQRIAETVEERKSEVTRLAREREDAQHEQTTVGEKLAEVESKFDADAYQTVVATEQAARSEIGSLQAQASMLVKGLEEDASSIEALEAVAGEVEAKQAKAQGIVQNIDILTTIRTLLRQAGPYITRALIRQISEGAAQIYGDIMQDYSRHLAWNEDYGITLEVDGHERQFSQLSGGEQMTAALAVRLALLREMSNIDVAFFDEPTTDLDETRRESLARQILAIRGFRQLFVISHDDTFEQATQNLIRVERSNGTSRVQYG